MPDEMKCSMDGMDGAVPAELHEAAVTHSGYLRWKRVLDVVLAAAALAVLFVPLLLVMLLIWVDDPGPVFFAQQRIGLYGRRFRMFKFRSMRLRTPEAGPETEDSADVVTRVGRFLRRFSVDELPQLINVLLGDMSLVGPRPLIPQEADVHCLRLRCGVYRVRPGITGLAQINGRSTLPPAQKVWWDVRYVERCSLGTDVRIVLATIPRLLVGSGMTEDFAGEPHGRPADGREQ